MSFDTRMVFVLLAFANFVVASAVGTIVPNFWMAMLCIAVLFVRPVMRFYRSRRWEALWKASGGDQRPPDDYVTV